jgi:peptidoglycan lytic transglycosylase
MTRCKTVLLALVVVAGSLTGAEAREYRVRRGDSLWRIARQHGTSVNALRRANGLRGDLLHVGVVLRIPDRGSSARREAPAPSRAAPTGVTRSRSSMPASSRDLEVLARIVKGECPANMPFEGKVAVASVVLNRVRSARYPNTIPGVAHQRLQFSCYNANFRRRLYWGRIPDYAWRAARAALAGQAPVGEATHYFNPHLVSPSWARRMTFVRRIGRSRSTTHDFYLPRSRRRASRGMASRVERP